MSEWWTYRPGDLRMFSPRTYFRLFELYNRDLWPAHLLALAIGVATVGLMLRYRPTGRRWALALLAPAWLWVAWGYFLVRYATIHWAGIYIAAVFAAQAALLAGIAARTAQDGVAPHPVRYRVGGGLLLAGLFAPPMMWLVLDRPWPEAQVFGLAPDPTVVATLGVLLACPRVPWALLAIPLAWGAFSSMTLFTLDAPFDAALPLGAAVLTLWAAIRHRPLAVS